MYIVYLDECNRYTHISRHKCRPSVARHIRGCSSDLQLFPCVPERRRQPPKRLAHNRRQSFHRSEVPRAHIRFPKDGNAVRLPRQHRGHPLLQPIRRHPPVQLADFCAYAVFRYYERGDDRFLNKIIHRFDRCSRDFAGVDGLKHITQRACDCISCSGR